MGNDDDKIYKWTPENIKPENTVKVMNMLMARIIQLKSVCDNLFNAGNAVVNRNSIFNKELEQWNAACAEYEGLKK